MTIYFMDLARHMMAEIYKNSHETWLRTIEDMKLIESGNTSDICLLNNHQRIFVKHMDHEKQNEYGQGDFLALGRYKNEDTGVFVDEDMVHLKKAMPKSVLAHQRAMVDGGDATLSDFVYFEAHAHRKVDKINSSQEQESCAIAYLLANQGKPVALQTIIMETMFDAADLGQSA